eukprot:668313-Amphidinium_carterae.4
MMVWLKNAVIGHTLLSMLDYLIQSHFILTEETPTARTECIKFPKDTSTAYPSPKGIPTIPSGHSG